MYGRKRYSREELKSFLLQYTEENGKPPLQRDFLHNPDYPSFKQYINEFGSWSAAIIKCGLRDTQYPINKNVHICQNPSCQKEFIAYGTRKYCSDQCRYEGSRKEYTSSSGNASSYRRVAFSRYPWKCAICGYKEHTNHVRGSKFFKYPVILDVHHLDGNRENNDPSNLAILCPTCHALIHRGVYVKVRRSNLFRDKLCFDISPEEGAQESPFEEVKSRQ